MFLVEVKCKTESVRRAKYLVIAGMTSEHACELSLKKWNEYERIHPDCVGEVVAVTELTEDIPSTWKIAFVTD